MEKLYEDVEQGFFEYFYYNCLHLCTDTYGKLFKSVDEIKVEYDSHMDFCKKMYIDRYNSDLVKGFLEYYDSKIQFSKKYSDKNKVYSLLFAIFRAIDDEYDTERFKVVRNADNELDVLDELMGPDEIRMHFNTIKKNNADFYDRVLRSVYLLGCSETMFIALSKNWDRDIYFKEKNLYVKYDFFPKSYYLLQMLYKYGYIEMDYIRSKRQAEIDLGYDTSDYIKDIMHSRYDRWDKIIKDLLVELKEDLEKSEYSSKDFFEKHSEISYDAIFKFVTASPFIMSFGSYAARGGNLRQRPTV